MIRLSSISGRWLRPLLCIIALVAFSTIVPSQTLQTLPSDPKIHNGVLGNGTKYYLVANSGEKGMVDIALVQKVGKGDESASTAAETTVQAKKSLTDLPRFQPRGPFRYLCGKGIFPIDKGYVEVTEGATIFHFDDLMLSRSADIVDSTMLMIFDIIGRETGPLNELYSPQNQAIIVAGDINTDAVLTKMLTLSMLVTKQQATLPVKNYEWKSREYRDFVFTEAEEGSPYTTFTAVYSSPRTPVESMGTLQPLVSRKFAYELGVIIRRRLYKELKTKGLPFYNIDFSYRGSGEGPGDETYTLSVATDKDKLSEVAAVVAGVLSDIDTKGSSEGEYKDAQNENIMHLRMSGTDFTTNAAYVQKCISSYLYGTSLASEQTALNYFLGRELDPKTGVKLFNSFASALLDREQNLTLSINTELSPSLESQVSRSFDSSWKDHERSANISFSVSNSDTTSLVRNFSKSKLKNESVEPMSGGKMWTFANGVRVIYKNMPTSGVLYYTWLLKGGYSAFGSMPQSDRIRISDMALLCDVAGMTSTGFTNMLSSNGIDLGVEVTYSDIRIEGSLPGNKLSLLLKSFLSLFNERRPSTEAFNDYRQNLSLRTRGRVTVSEDLQQRSERFFKTAFDKMNDGVFIIVGNYNEEALKKTLSQYLGGFRTDKVSSYRSRPQSAAPEESSSEIVDGTRLGIRMDVSAPLTFTVDNYMASQVAALALQQTIAKAAAQYGWYSKGSFSYDVFPQERAHVTMRLAPADYRGLPASMVATDSVQLVSAGVGRALAQLGQKGLSTNEATAFVQSFASTLSSKMSDPNYIVTLLVLRYSYGKDLMTGCERKAASVTPAKVNEMLALFARGSIKTRAVGRSASAPQVREPQLPQAAAPRVPRVAPPADSLGLSALYFELFNPAEEDEQEQ